MLVFQRAEVTSMEPDVQAVNWRDWSGMAQEAQRPPDEVEEEEETFVCLGQEAPCRTRTASMKEEPYQRKDWTKDSAIAERRKRNESTCQMKTLR
ncbi:uncharacterized protein LOC144007918 isoform X6 [Festucalex cinctus]